MTVATQSSKSGPWTADGVQTQYPFAFPVMDAAHIAVYVAESDNRYARKLTSGYRVDLAEDGGTVVLDKPLEKGQLIAIIRSVPTTQETDIQNNTAFYPEIMEDAFDKLTMIVQQQGEVLERCAKVPVTSTEDPLTYLQTLSEVSTNAKDVALNAADAAAHSALTASISERNMSLIWAELTGDSSLADNALITVKEAAEATGAIKTAKEIAIGEINGVGAMAIASTEKAAKEALDAAKAATDSAGDITGRVDDAITIQVSQAVGADGVLGVAIAAGVSDVEAARQQALDRANATLTDIMQGSQAFEVSKEQGISEINQKIAGVALDVETALARAQLIADGYLEDAQATVSGSLSDLEKMKADAIAAGKKELVALIEKRIGELNTLSGYLTDAESAAKAADTFRKQTQGIADGFTVTVDGALATVNGRVNAASGYANDALARAQAAASSATGASTSASNALKSAQDAAVSASNANASALAAGSAATEAAQTAAANSITAHNANSNAHSGVLLSCAGGTMTSRINTSYPVFAGRTDDDLYIYLYGGSDRGKGAHLLLCGQNYSASKGTFRLSASADNTTKELYGDPSGRLVWDSKNIVRSVDGVNADGAGNVNITAANVGALPLSGGKLTGVPLYRDVDNSYIQLAGGSSSSGGAYFVAYGKDHASYGGRAIMYANDGTKSSVLTLFPDGQATIAGRNIVRSVGGKTADAAGNVDLHGIGMPNYAAGVDVLSSYASGWTATADGWVSLYIYREDNTTEIFINGVYVGLVGGAKHVHSTVFLPLKKGDRITVGSGNPSRLYFYPNR